MRLVTLVGNRNGRSDRSARGRPVRGRASGRCGQRRLRADEIGRTGSNRWKYRERRPVGIRRQRRQLGWKRRHHQLGRRCRPGRFGRHGFGRVNRLRRQRRYDARVGWLGRHRRNRERHRRQQGHRGHRRHDRNRWHRRGRRQRVGRYLGFGRGGRQRRRHRFGRDRGRGQHGSDRAVRHLQVRQHALRRGAQHRSRALPSVQRSPVSGQAGSEKTTKDIPVLSAGGFVDISVQDLSVPARPARSRSFTTSPPNNNNLAKSPNALVVAQRW